jgi:serine/threonine protein kinase
MRSHRIAEQVLHRDVRPSNIMVPFFFSYANRGVGEQHRFDVVLLNYDMSWHKYARGGTISGQVEDLGYYAPEQIREGLIDVSTVSTLVDSYMFGMTVYFAVAAEHPPHGGSSIADWAKMVRRLRATGKSPSWKSAGARLQRLILATTHPNQRDRPGLTSINAELRQLRDAIVGVRDELSVDFWGEELFAKIVDVAEYLWDDQTLKGSYESRAGRSVQLSCSTSQRNFTISFVNMATEATNRLSASRMWHAKLANAKQGLVTVGWNVLEITSRQRQIVLSAQIGLDDVVDDLDRICGATAAAIQQVRLD